METPLIEQVLDWIQANPVLAMLAAFVFSFLEALVVVGLFIPGIILLFAVGALVGTDPLGLALIWIGASAGAVAGDGVSYWLGYRYRDGLRHVWPFSRRPDLLAAGNHFISRHGGKSVFIGRFIGPLRPVVPVVAGSLGMSPRQFFAIAVPACVLWAPAYLLPGVLFGASLAVIAEFGGRLAVVVAVLVGGVWFTAWLVRVIYEASARRSTWWLKSAVTWTRRHPVMGRMVGPILEPGRRESLSVALMGLLLVISVAVLLMVLVLAPFGTPAWDAERHAAGLAASLRNHFADPAFVAISLVGDLRVMLLLAAASALLFTALGRRNVAWHWLAALLGAGLSAALLNRFMGLLLERPEAALSLGQVPHLDFTVAVVTLGFFAVVIAKDLSARNRKWPYLFTTAVLSLIGFAHFYLGRASVSGLVAALTLAMGWLAIIGIAYRQRTRPRRGPVLVLLGFYAAFFSLGTWHVGQHYAVLLETSRISQPGREIQMLDWWAKDWTVLRERRSRFGRDAVQRFDFQLAGDLAQARDALIGHGWEALPPVTLSGLAAVFSGRPDAREIPHLPRDFAGRPENLALRRVEPDGTVIVLRLWASGVRLSPGEVPVWLGQVRRVRRAGWLGVVTTWRSAPDPDAKALVELQAALYAWIWYRPDDRLWLIRPPALPVSSAVDPSVPADHRSPATVDARPARKAAARPAATPG